MIPSIWDGVTPLRQVGLGVFKLTHEENHQLSLFEDSSIDAYRAWDIEYDEKMLQQHGRHRFRRGRKTLLFAYKTGEEALSAAKRAVKENKGCTMARNPLPDGTDCFEIRTAEGDVLERHTVIQILK